MQRYRNGLYFIVPALLVMLCGCGSGRLGSNPNGENPEGDLNALFDWSEKTDGGPYSRAVGVPTLLSPEDGAHLVEPTNLTWSEVSGATNYQVKMVLPSGRIGRAGTTKPKLNLKTVWSLLSNGRYQWRVRAKDADGWGDYCDPWTFTKKTTYGEVGSISGKVTERKTGEPIPGAIVTASIDFVTTTVEGSSGSRATFWTVGDFLLEDLPAGTYIVRAAKVGYRSDAGSAQGGIKVIPSKERKNVNLTLTALGLSEEEEEPDYPDLEESDYRAVCVDPGRPYLYLTNYERNSIFIVSTHDYGVVKEIWVGSNPWYLDIDPLGQELYVGLNGTSDIAVVDLEAQEAGDIITMSVSNPYVVHTGRPGRLYVQASPDYGACCSRIIDTENRLEIPDDEDGEQFACSYDDFQVSSDGNFLYSQVCAGGSPAYLVKYDISTDVVAGVDDVMIGSGRRRVALRPTDDLVCLSDGEVYRTSTLSLAGTLEEWEAAAYTPDGNILLLATGTQLTGYDMQTLLPIGTYTLSGPIHSIGNRACKSLAVDPDGQRIYALVAGSTAQILEVVGLDQLE